MNQRKKNSTPSQSFFRHTKTADRTNQSVINREVLMAAPRREEKSVSQSGNMTTSPFTTMLCCHCWYTPHPRLVSLGCRRPLARPQLSFLHWPTNKLTQYENWRHVTSIEFDARQNDACWKFYFPASLPWQLFPCNGFAGVDVLPTRFPRRGSGTIADAGFFAGCGNRQRDRSRCQS